MGDVIVSDVRVHQMSMLLKVFVIKSVTFVESVIKIGHMQTFNGSVSVIAIRLSRSVVERGKLGRQLAINPLGMGLLCLLVYLFHGYYQVFVGKFAK